MTLFEWLCLGHLIGDWLAQTEWQALNKTRHWRALLTHIAVYHLILLVILVSRLGWGDARIWIALVLLALSHALLDRRWFTLRWMKTFRLVVQREPQHWLVLAVDQSMHLVLIGVATIVLT